MSKTCLKLTRKTQERRHQGFSDVLIVSFEQISDIVLVFAFLQFPADLVTFAEEILYGKLHFLCNVGLQECTDQSKSSIFDFC